MIVPMPSTPSRPWNADRAWRAVVARDRAADEAFVYAVRTTGVYCRPSCPSRRANRANVAFFETPATAAAAGFRACRRCRPDRPATDPVAAARTLLDGSDRLTLTTLAARVGLSPAHLHRSFKSRYGQSPRDYQAARRRERLRRALRDGRGVLQATYQAGYGSSSRVYERADADLGMTPAQFARGGRGLVIRYAIVPSPVAPRLLVAVTDRGICAVLPGSNDPALEADLAREFPNATLTRVDRGDAWLTAQVKRVAHELAGRTSAEPLRLDLRGTEFQQRVWRALLEVPRGATRSYQDLARGIGRRSAVRAVASAVAKNRLAVVVPCHRIIRGDGSLAGYRWGLPLKARLLAAERASA